MACPDLLQKPLHLIQAAGIQKVLPVEIIPRRKAYHQRVWPRNCYRSNLRNWVCNINPDIEKSCSQIGKCSLRETHWASRRDIISDG